MYRFTVQLGQKKDRLVLAQIAADFGLLARAGAGAGAVGSSSRLLRGIVRGEYKVVKVEKNERENKVVS